MRHGDNNGLKRDESRFQRWIGTYYFPGALPQAANERCAVGAKRILAVSAARNHLGVSRKRRCIHFCRRMPMTSAISVIAAHIFANSSPCRV